MKRTICWFSCGAASAVATKLAIVNKQEGEELIVVYQDTGSEHPDNKRFFAECQEWFGQEIIVLKSDKYANVDEVIEKTRYMAGVGGARCTGELKRIVAEKFINFFHDREVFGYTSEERKRVQRFIEHNPERDIYPILIERELKKQDCLAMVASAGIELPVMYKLGYKNNNCIGCVKGGAGYWNMIRKDFPEVFARRAKQERMLNATINKKYVEGVRTKVFLDELPPNMGNHMTEPDISCGIMCMIAEEEIGADE